MSFNYILKKIENAQFVTDPFKHLLIPELLSEAHFAEVIADYQIKRPAQKNTRALIEDLISIGYKIQPFAGSIESIDDYIEFLADKSNFNARLLRGQGTKILSGYGMTMRLEDIRSPVLNDLANFLNSREFVDTLLDKFDITRSVRIETAYQKNLTGYNLNPHPDMRDKALTYMANIYTEKDSHKQNFHTHFLSFKKEYSYIYDFWRHNQNIETCWVPWDWCETKVLTSRNNCISIFQPAHDTLHAVDVDYDHLKEQRNQIYGNLWYEEVPDVYDSGHTLLDLPALHSTPSIKKSAAKKLLRRLSPKFSS